MKVISPKLKEVNIMGSGISGNYSGTIEASQPYSNDYGVTPEMLDFDIQRGVYVNGEYEINPTAKNINDVINGEYIISNKRNKTMTYVIDLNDNIIVAERNGNGFNGKATPHPTLIGGKNPRVKMAGVLNLKDGKILSYDNMSGHFKPNIKSMKVAKEVFGKLPDYLFDGGKKND
jgi:hypothetical protein